MQTTQRAYRAHRLSAVFLILAVLLLWTAGPASAASDPVLKVMTYNVYYGGRLETLFLATPDNLFELVGEVWTQVQETDLAARAEAIADQISSADPHVVGLQETPLWRSQFPGDAGFSAASTVRFDFLELLLDALEARGRHYAPVASVTNLDAEVPRLDPTSPTGIEDIRLTDRDVIIARTDLPANVFSVSNGQGGNFETNLVFPFGVFAGVEVPRGWTSVDVSLRGRTVRVVNTHLERFFPAVQVAQGQEILDGPADPTLSIPVVVLGDLNSAAGGGAVPGESDTPTYGNFLAAGFTDAWSAKHGTKEGFTCCQTADLDDPSTLSERIDVALVRGSVSVASSGRFGDEESDRTPSGHWPSDHAGVTAVLRLG
jgi:hypothetical protein